MGDELFAGSGVAELLTMSAPIESRDRCEVLSVKKPLDIAYTFTNRNGETWTELIPFARIRSMVTAAKDPAFNRARSRPSICGYETVLIYRRDASSPSGVYLSGAGPAVIIDRLLRRYQRTSALSPTEGRFL